VQNYSQIDWRATLDAAKPLFTIHRQWVYFGLPGAPSAKCRVPWRTDKNPSLSVSAAGLLYNDFSRAEGGDNFRFFQKVSGLRGKESLLRFADLAGVTPITRSTLTPARPQPQAAPPRAKPVFPSFRAGTPAELDALSKLRGIGIEGLQFAAERGLLAFATLKGCPAWVVTDSARLNAQARRLDGKPWEHIGAKAWTAKGSWAAWPVGLGEAQGFPAIALCEGGPDLLAAHYWILWEQASHHTKRDVRSVPIAMLGASLSIPEDALPLFAGKKVRIFEHNDESGAGRKAAARWATQLQRVGADVDAFDFEGLVQVNGSPIKDLNDALFADAKSFAELERIMP